MKLLTVLGILFGSLVFLVVSVYWTSRPITLVAIEDVTDSPEAVVEKSNVPLGKWGSSIAFGDGGEVVVSGTATLVVSLDSGRTWRNLAEGWGYESISIDGGITWSNVSPNPAKFDSNRVCYVEASTIVSEAKRLYLRANCDHSAQIWSIPLVAGSPWYLATFLPEREDLATLAPDLYFKSAAESVFVRGVFRDGPGMLATRDDGKTWTPLRRRSLFGSGVRDFSFIDAANGWLVERNGSVVLTRDGGESWSNLARYPSDIETNSLVLVDQETAYLAGKEGLILKTKDAGRTWEGIRISPSVDWYKIAAGARSTWVSGNSNTVFGSMDGGKSWSKAEILCNRKIYSNFTVHGDAAWIVCDQTMNKVTMQETRQSIAR